MLIGTNGEKILRLNGFKFGEEILVTDSDSMSTKDPDTGEVKELEKVVVCLEPSLVRFLVNDGAVDMSIDDEEEYGYDY